MNRLENYLVVIMEEAAEVQKEAAKAIRFGLNNHNPDKPKCTNERQLLTEFYELTAMIEYLQDNGCLSVISDNKIEDIKKDKISRMLDYTNLSIEMGIVKGETK